MPSLPPTAYRYPASTATPTPSLRVLIDATFDHRFVCGSYLQPIRTATVRCVDSHQIRLKRVSSYIAQYPSPQDCSKRSTFYFHSELFTQSVNHHLCFSGKRPTNPPLSISRYLFIQLTELEQRRVKKLAQD